MKTIFVLGSLAFLTLASAVAEPEIKGTAAELSNYLSNSPRTVVLAGEGEVKAPADKAVITLKVSTEHKSLAEALRANGQVRARFAEFLKEHGLSGDRIQPSRFSSTPKRGVFSDKVKSQQVENLVKVTVRDEKEFETVATLPDKFSEVAYVGVEFEHSQKDVLKRQAIGEACEDADKRRQVFEKQLGLKLVPKGFVEQPLDVVGRRPIGVQGGTAPSFIGSPASYNEVEIRRAVAAEAIAAETFSAFGELSFKVRVTIEYSAQADPPGAK